MTRMVLTSLSLVAMLSVAAGGACAQGNEVGIQTLEIQNEAIELNGAKSRSNTNSGAQRARGTNSPNEVTTRSPPSQDDRYGRVKVQFHWDREK
jgi:hypothetical protein